MSANTAARKEGGQGSSTASMLRTVSASFLARGIFWRWHEDHEAT